MNLSRTDRAPLYKGRVRVRLMESLLPPEVMFSAVQHLFGSMFLDSALIDRYGLGRWSFIVFDPLFVFSSREDTVAFRIGNTTRWESSNPLLSLRRTLGLFSVTAEPSWIPFRGGVAGFFGYELGRSIERLPVTVEDDLDLPECFLGFYDTVLAYDHVMEQWFLCHTDFGLNRPGLEYRLRQVRDLARKAVHSGRAQPTLRTGPLQSNFTKQQYMAAINRARLYIEAGDIYQVNLSQRFSVQVEQGSSWDLYQRLRQVNAAPFAAFIQGGGFQVLSSSPERFLKVIGDRVETRPIKGTRPRGATEREDAWYRAQLLASVKDQAELAMIVDLERNDLGRVSTYGSVAVTRHAQCESYARVHHLVSTIEANLRKDRDVADLLIATFPGGSITGAPKIRSMQIIDELEPQVRSAYCGSMGFITFEGDMDLNIGIRTVIMKDKKAYFGAGGGIVYDSDPEMEYDETYDKALAIIEALTESKGPF